MDVIPPTSTILGLERLEEIEAAGNVIGVVPSATGLTVTALAVSGNLAPGPSAEEPAPAEAANAVPADAAVLDGLFAELAASEQAERGTFLVSTVDASSATSSATRGEHPQTDIPSEYGPTPGDVFARAAGPVLAGGTPSPGGHSMSPGAQPAGPASNLAGANGSSAGNPYVHGAPAPSGGGSPGGGSSGSAGATAQLNALGIQGVFNTAASTATVPTHPTEGAQAPSAATAPQAPPAAPMTPVAPAAEQANPPGGGLPPLSPSGTPTVQFSSVSYSAGEASGQATITVTLSAPSSTDVQVFVSASGGTASQGIDYTPIFMGHLTIPANTTSATFNVNLLDDGGSGEAGPQTVNLSLSSPSGATLGTPSAAVLSITEDADASPTAVSDSYSVAHDITLSVPAAGVLGNDSDPNGLPLTASLVSGSGPSHGSLTLNSDGSFTYTPNAGYVGSDSFQYQASDGTLTSPATTVSLTVTNTAPSVVAHTYGIPENTTENVTAASGVLAGATDPAGRSLTASLVSGSGPSHGSLTLNTDGSFSYTPNAGYTGTDSFQYEANDGTQNSNVAVASLTIHSTNAAPVAVADTYTVQHDQIFSVFGQGVLANDSDADGDPLTVSLVSGSGPAHGTLTLNPDGPFTYTPNAGFTGTDSFQYVANDGLANSAPATVTLTVVDPNPPVANNDSYGVHINTALTVAAGVGVLANDSDADGDPLTASLVAGSGPGHGALTLNSDGSFTYTPNTGYTGSDSFRYTASDGVLTSTATVMLNVHASNSAPVASAHSYTVQHDQTLNVSAAGVLSNATDADGDPLTASVASGPSNGTLTLNSDGSFAYTPNAGYTGTDSFQYTASDGLASSAAATVTITVTDPHAPVAVGDTYTVAHNGVLNTYTNSVLANDSDADGDPLTASLVTGSGPSNGALTFNPDGSFIYTPNVGYVGSDSFQYTASDGALTSNPATVSITVTNSAPVALNDAYSVLHDTTLSVPASGLLNNDFDPEGDPITAVLMSQGQHGVATVNSDGSFTYTSAPGYTGPDSFTYSASDGSLASSPATVNITVKAADQAPVANGDSYSLAHDTTLQTSASNGVLANDSDPDGDPLIAELASGPGHGTLSLNVDGSFSYTPAAGYSGPDSFTYQSFDGTTSSAAATVSLTVTNDVPVANNDTISVLSSGTTTVPANQGVLVNDTDGEGDTLTAIPVSNPAHGTLGLNSDGSFTYTPGTGFTGTDSFTYKASDGVNQSNVATVTVTVGPVALADSYSVNHDTTLTVSSDEGLLLNDTDATGASLTTTGVTQPSHGTVAVNSDGSFTYTPAAHYVGPDSFQYKATDGSLTSSAATVTIQVIDNPPVGTPSTFDLLQNTTLTVSGAEVLGADYDPEGDAMTAVGPSSLTLAHGTLAYFNPDGSFQYTPNPGYVGTDQFYYTLSDGLESSAPVQVTLKVDAAPTVNIISCSRGGDLVVSAKDVANGMPGGEKVIAVAVTGAGAATLTISTKPGTRGSAVFIVGGKETTTMTVPGNQSTFVTIYGRDVSNVAKNMQIQAKLGQAVADTWAFTVFSVTPNLMINPNTQIAAAIPAKVKNVLGQPLQEYILDGTRDHPNLGHHHFPEDIAYGGMVMQGKIMPQGMNPADFNQAHSRFESFNWDRTLNSRFYKNNQFYTDKNIDSTGDQLSDDQSDTDESLKAGADLGTTDLYIWSVDFPKKGKGLIPDQGDTLRTRDQFYEVATYAGVKVSPTVPWYWVSAQKNVDADNPFVQDDTYTVAKPPNQPVGDNTVGRGTTFLTIDLAKSQVPKWTIQNFQPKTISTAQPNPIAFTLSLSQLPLDQAKKALIYLIREVSGDQGTTRDVIPLTFPGAGVSNAGKLTSIKGTFTLVAFQPLGKYILKVFIGDTVSSLPVTIQR